MSMKAELAGGSLLRLSFFPAYELHKGNMYTGIPPLSELPAFFSEISEPIGFFDATPCFVLSTRSRCRNFLIIFTSRKLDTSLFLSLNFSPTWSDQCKEYPLQRCCARSFPSNDSPRTRSSARFFRLFSPLKTGLV